MHINPLTTHNSSNRFDEGLTLETSAFLLFTVANLCQLLTLIYLFFQLRMWLSKSHREDEVLTAFKRILEWNSPNQDEISLQKCHLPVEVCQLISDEDLGKNKFD